MPSLITTPLYKDLFASAAKAHAEHGLDFQGHLAHYCQSGYVFKGPDFFLMGREDPEDPDAWLIWWAECYPTRRPSDMVALFIRFMPHYRKRIAWVRMLKGKTELKYYSTDRLLRIKQGQASTR